MDINSLIKDPRVTKCARGLTCLFALLTLIGAMVAVFSSIGIAASSDSIYSFSKQLKFLESFTGGAAMARAMAIVTFILTIGTGVLAYFSRDNFVFSIVAGAAVLIQFILGLVISPICSMEGLVRLALITDSVGGYIFALIVIILMSAAAILCNILGIIIKDKKVPLFSGLQQVTDKLIPPQPVNSQPQMMQGMQPAQQAQPMQPMGQPQQMQQPYPQQVQQMPQQVQQMPQQVQQMPQQVQQMSQQVQQIPQQVQQMPQQVQQMPQQVQQIPQPVQQMPQQVQQIPQPVQQIPQQADQPQQTNNDFNLQ